jgi:hypothetical protein
LEICEGNSRWVIFFCCYIVQSSSLFYDLVSVFLSRLFVFFQNYTLLHVCVNINGAPCCSNLSPVSVDCEWWVLIYFARKKSELSHLGCCYEERHKFISHLCAANEECYTTKRVYCRWLGWVGNEWPMIVLCVKKKMCLMIVENLLQSQQDETLLIYLIFSLSHDANSCRSRDELMIFLKICVMDTTYCRYWKCYRENIW